MYSISLNMIEAAIPAIRNKLFSEKKTQTQSWSSETRGKYYVVMLKICLSVHSILGAWEKEEPIISLG